MSTTLEKDFVAMLLNSQMSKSMGCQYHSNCITMPNIHREVKRIQAMIHVDYIAANQVYVVLDSHPIPSLKPR